MVVFPMFSDVRAGSAFHPGLFVRFGVPYLDAVS
jgi:hypothetical protein